MERNGYLKMSCYAITDLHGRYDLWRLVVESISEDSTLIFLGDAIDRGEGGIAIVNELRARPNTIYLKGNHEDLAVKALPFLINDNDTFLPIVEWFRNGGDTTWESLKNLPKEKILEYIDFWKNLPETYVYTNKRGQKIICDHCGFTPGGQDYEPLWDRDHFEEKWSLDKKWKDTYVVHGHTPKQLLGYFSSGAIEVPKNYPGSFKYCDGHKIDLDCASVNSNETVLLNLDDFTERVFYNMN